MTVYSHSRLSSFENCKLQFKYKYIDKIKTEIEQSVEAFMGSRVHDTLEHLYKTLRFQKILTKQELILFLESEWHKNWNDNIVIVRKEFTQDDYLKMAKKFVSDYYDRYKPFNQSTIIGTEIHVMIDLDKEGKYKLQGYIDRLDSKEELYEIHDYKTSNTLPEQKYLDSDRQLALYAIAVKQRYQDAKEVKLIWHFLAFDKEFSSSRKEDELEQLKKDTIKLINDIESCEDFPPKTSALCDWCEFRSICPEWKHEYELEQKTPEEFKQDDGVKLVDEYSKLKAEEKLINEKLDYLKDKIIAFASQKNITKVVGSNQQAAIWSKECCKFPKATDYKYPDFVNLVKKLGLWNEFSKLDSFKLEKAFENREFYGEIYELLRNFINKEKVERIYLRKK